MKRLVNHVAIITGAASGIGLACAKRFAEEGATVVGIDLQTCSDWNCVTDHAPQSALHQLDVTDKQAQEQIAQQTIKDFGHIDSLVTAAGIADAGPVNMIEEDSWDRVININLKGTFLSAKAVLPAMINQRSGSIVTIASIEGLCGTEGGSAYNASKGGVVLLSKNIAIDYGRLGIRCNAICPGFINTPLFRSVVDQDFLADFRADIQRETKLKRFGEPQEIANVALFLASGEASFLTGQAIAVDGGYTAGHSHGLVELMGLV